MISIRNIREQKGLSQRALAHLSGLSFRTLQLAESGGQNLTLYTLQKISKALGYPNSLFDSELNQLFSSPPESVFCISKKILEEGFDSWKIYLFEFVDAFSSAKEESLKLSLVQVPPDDTLPFSLKVLMAATVEHLCESEKRSAPWWCKAFAALDQPWFVADTENLKASALVESPVSFRKRRIFVLDNFLERL